MLKVYGDEDSSVIEMLILLLLFTGKLSKTIEPFYVMLST